MKQNQNQPQQGGQGLLEGSEEQMFQQLSDGISDYFHGPAREHVSKSIADAGTDEALADTIATISYQTLHQVSEQVAQASPESVTLELLLPLATEAIDFLIEIAQAIGVPTGDLTELREDSLGRMIEIHMAAIGDDPEQKAVAEEMFAEFLEDGTFEEATGYVDERIKARGGDPEMIRREGAQMGSPQPDKLSAGVRQGLLEQGGR